MSTTTWNEDAIYIKSISGTEYTSVLEKLLQALQALYDAQNGAPLERDRLEWEEAMRKAEEAIAKARGK